MAGRGGTGAGIRVCGVDTAPPAPADALCGRRGQLSDTLVKCPILGFLTSSLACWWDVPILRTPCPYTDPYWIVETVPARQVDRDTLLSAPLNLLVSTAIALSRRTQRSSPKMRSFRQTATLCHEQQRRWRHNARLLVETFVLADVERRTRSWRTPPLRT